MTYHLQKRISWIGLGETFKIALSIFIPANERKSYFSKAKRPKPIFMLADEKRSVPAIKGKCFATLADEASRRIFAMIYGFQNSQGMWIPTICTFFRIGPKVEFLTGVAFWLREPSWISVVWLVLTGQGSIEIAWTTKVFVLSIPGLRSWLNETFKNKW